MKKIITKISVLIFILLLSGWNVSAQELTIAQPSALTSWATTSNGVTTSYTGTCSVSSSSAACLTGNTFRIGSNTTTYLKIVSTKPITRITFDGCGNAAGTTVYTNVILTSTDGGTTWCTETNAITFTTTGYDQTCTRVDKTFSGGINALQIWRKYGSTGSGQTLRMGNLNVYSPNPNPNVVKTSGADPASAMETMAMTPVVYTYSNMADANNVLADWYTDNTYTATTTAPSGLSLAKDVTAKTVTLAGTPASGTVGTYYYKITANETGGNALTGSVVVSAYVTPAPVITTPSNNNQLLKAGAAISDIVFTMQNESNASVSGLPNGLSGAYVAGKYTISGTVDAGATPGIYTFTVTANKLSGYTGSDVTATGTINVKSTTARQILYLTVAGTVSTTDVKFYPSLLSNPNYIVTVKTAAAAPPTNFTDYTNYDLIVLNESVASANAEADSLRKVDKPILNFKSFVYAALPKWGWGTPDNGNITNLSVAIKQPTHPIFNGLTSINAGSLDLLSAVSGSKGIQPADVTLSGSINVATAPKATGTGIAIHDVPASVRAANAGKTITSKYLMIPISDLSYGNLTNDAVTLLNNAIDYLLNGTQFVAPSLQIATFNVNGVDATIDHTAGTISVTLASGTSLTGIVPTITLSGTGTTASVASTDFTASVTTPVNVTVTDGINSKIYKAAINADGTTGIINTKLTGLAFDGKTIHNANRIALQMYDTKGQLIVTTNADIQFDNYNKGIYLVKSSFGTFKIVFFK